MSQPGFNMLEFPGRRDGGKSEKQREFLHSLFRGNDGSQLIQIPPVAHRPVYDY